MRRTCWVVFHYNGGILVTHKQPLHGKKHKHDTYHKTEQLPRQIQEALAVLQLCEVGTGVPGVGRHIQPYHFKVQYQQN